MENDNLDELGKIILDLNNNSFDIPLITDIKFDNSLSDSVIYTVNNYSAPSYITIDTDNFYQEMKEIEEFTQILRDSKNNPALQQALDRVKILYYLSKDDEQNNQI